MRDGIRDIQAWAEAATQQGMSAKDVTTFVNQMTENLIQQSKGFFASEAEARKYIQTLGMTPENIATIFSVPGLLEATISVAAYDSDLDGIPNEHDTEFTVDAALARETLAAMGVDVSNVPDQVLIDFLTNNAAAVTDEVEGLDMAVDRVDGSTGTATVAAAGAEDATGQMQVLREQLETLPDSSATVDIPGAMDRQGEMEDLTEVLENLPDSTAYVYLPGIVERWGEVNDLGLEIDDLHDKSVTITAETTFASQEIGQLALQIAGIKDKTVTIRTNNVGQVTGTGMTGALINSPQVMNVGERGFAEAIVPLQLPLSRVNPEVRAMAELLRGGPVRSAAPSGGKTVNNYMTIQPLSADPMAVATQVINRSAMLANR
jgi:hypothetical protein